MQAKMIDLVPCCQLCQVHQCFQHAVFHQADYLRRYDGYRLRIPVIGDLSLDRHAEQAYAGSHKRETPG
jgi:hypothetical protein